MQDTTPHLTPERISQAALTLQALDIEAEKTFIKHADAAKKELKKPVPIQDHEVSEFVEEFNSSVPGHILLMDGHGYRALLTILANILLAIERPDLSQAVLEAREQEQI